MSQVKDNGRPRKYSQVEDQVTIESNQAYESRRRTLRDLTGCEFYAHTFNNEEYPPSPLLFWANLSPEVRLEVEAFLAVDKELSRRVYLDQLSPIRKLMDNNDVFRNVLDHLAPKTPFLPADHRRSMSVESFATVQLSDGSRGMCQRDPGETCLENCCALRRLRLVSKDFSNHAFILERQFQRIVTQFTDDPDEGFEKLRKISESKHLAQHVNHFIYMITPLYRQDSLQFQAMWHDFVAAAETAISTGEDPPIISYQAGDLDIIENSMERVEIRQAIVKEGKDFQVLLQAFTQFTHLRKIQLMKLVFRDEEAWAALLERNREYFSTYGDFDWTYAFRNAARTLSSAVELSNSPVSQFSSKFIDHPSPGQPLPSDFRSITASIAGRLTSLEIQLENNDKTQELSPVFNVIFRELKNLKGLHIGFFRRVSVPLDTVFHGVTLPRLTHLGIHMWSTTAQELIDLLGRHQNTLHSVRLRYVLLPQRTEEAGGWKEVLEFMRQKLTRLSLVINGHKGWVTLRNINYVSNVPAFVGMHPVQLPGHGGQLVNPDGGPGGDNEGDDGSQVSDHEDAAEHAAEDASEDDAEDVAEDSGEEEEEEEEHSADDTAENPAVDVTGDITEDTAEEEARHSAEEATTSGPHEESSDEITVEVEETEDFDGSDQESIIHEAESDIEEDIAVPEHMHQATITASQTQAPGLLCPCGERYGWSTIEDNGFTVVRDQWKHWEQWVIHRCPTHDPV